MDIDAFINANDHTLVYQCTYYHDPERWKEASPVTKKALNNLPWSDYIKYIDDDGKVSRKLDEIPSDEGGLYLFFIQGQTLPSSEMYLVYVGRALCTESENIQKRVKRYLWESNSKDGRPKIKRLFRHWKDFLYIRYCSTKDNTLIKAGESTLIRAILPPFNSELPDKIIYKEPVNAFLI